MYKLTQLGKQEVNTYIRELKAKRKEILDAHKDTADSTELPTIDDILMDIPHFEQYGEYCNGWGCTDNYDADYPLFLKRGVHYDDLDMAEEMNNLLWNILKDHYGHKVEIAIYGDPENPASITLEDMDTNEVILDAEIYTICARED